MVSENTLEKVSIFMLIFQVGSVFAIFAILLFVLAGTANWPAGWLFLVMFFGFVVSITVWLYNNNPRLLNERMKGMKREQKSVDKAIIGLTGILFTIWLALIPLDAARFGWFALDWYWQSIGALLLLFSLYLFHRTFRENPFLSPAIAVQKDAKQTVVSTGLYAYVRHPMYSAFLVFIPGTAMLLGSGMGLLFGAILVVMVAIRAFYEEKTMIAELKGYGDYLKKVKYRLIPYVW